VKGLERLTAQAKAEWADETVPDDFPGLSLLTDVFGCTTSCPHIREAQLILDSWSNQLCHQLCQCRVRSCIRSIAVLNWQLLPLDKALYLQCMRDSDTDFEGFSALAKLQELLSLHASSDG